MSVCYVSDFKTFFLDSPTATYAFRINEVGYAEHLYYGSPIPHDDLRGLRGRFSLSFFPSVPGNDMPGSCYSLFPSELTFANTGDYRESTVEVCRADGDRTLELLYDGYDILPEKPPVAGMPSLRGGETLVLHLRDKATEILCDLYYTLYENGALARHAVYRNASGESVVLNRAYSFAMSLPAESYEVLSLYGTHARECQVSRQPLVHTTYVIGSKRASSSNSHNPFLAVLHPDTTENAGMALGVNLVYSSSYVLKAEGFDDGSLLLTGGIQDDGFSWTLASGESFDTPETVLVYSDEGLGKMSRTFHDLYRRYLMPERFSFSPRPVVINNWEGTYFNFNGEKLRAIAEAVKDTGINTFVLDDGWFGKRDNDLSGLGDWFVNTEKMQGTLRDLADTVHGMGMKFGLWFEPEMISEDSNLFRAHPDYAIGAPSRPRCYSRHQFVADLTRADVRKAIADQINAVIRENGVDYVKWDFNRNITEFYSFALPAERQGGFAHRYALGLYDLFDRIVAANPDILFEGCSGGGARFDAGILAYFPQIWTSDDTDPEERTRIQYGTSYVYPLSAMSCHVAASPNPSTGRAAAMQTRADIAHLGATGYELDTTKLTEEEKEQIKRDVAAYHGMEDLVLNGSLYRVENPNESNFFGFMLVSPDRTRARLTAYRRLGSPNADLHLWHAAGLDEKKNYRVSVLNRVLSGAALSKFGFPLSFAHGDFMTVCVDFEAI